jgi:type III restriction enzyme
MALHPNFPKDPYAILDPKIRWFPADESLRENRWEKLMPPLVPKVREFVKEWREKNYEGASETTRALLKWWFLEEHVDWNNGVAKTFRYYFAQREAVETAIYLYEVVGVREPHDLLRYDSSGRVSTGMFTETWPRFVLKMATGAGKTKVLSLLIAWSYFHKMYEKNSELARNFLLIAPNIIVLDRIKGDFEGCRMFFNDPILPDNGYEGRNWQDDFQITVHLQDEVGGVSKYGNIFLTNIHRVYDKDVRMASAADENSMEYFLGNKPVTKTTDSSIDLGDIVREVDELMILNDEAHHIHDEKLAWFKSIEDISNRLKLKDRKLSLQLDVTATPKNDRGEIFVQTVCDYPLVEAIQQNVVKHPVLPDQASRAKLHEVESSNFIERYREYLQLGVIEWRKAFEEHARVGKKAVLFVMTDDTTNCDAVTEYLEKNFSELAGKVLTIHTNKSGEVKESAAQRKDKDELDRLRKESNELDSFESPYLAVVSVLMLKEGWDVRNVTTIVGLRAYASKSSILPEQTLGRGLRLMYFGQGVAEYVSVIGTPAFMDFVESIKAEGVELETRKMDRDSHAVAPVIVEVDRDNLKKDIEKLDIELPILSPRIFREYKNISDINLDNLDYKPVEYKAFSPQEQRQIVFKKIVTGEIDHVIDFAEGSLPDWRNAIGFYTQSIMRELRMVSGFEQLFPLVRDFVQDELFGRAIDLEDPNTVRNLSEIECRRTIDEAFKKAINELTVIDKGDAEIRNTIKISQARPFVSDKNEYLTPKKSVFNKIVGDSHLELEFGKFLDDCEDIVSFAKNYYEIQFRIDYKNADGSIAYYYPDFFVKVDNQTIYIIETKGREDLDDPRKIERLRQWCVDVNALQKKVKYEMLYVKQDEWEKYHPKVFADCVRAFEK